MIKTKQLQPKLNIQHNYISLKLPVGTFTTSFSGAKASGQLCQMPGAFEALDKYVQTASKTKSIGDSMKDLLDVNLLNKLVPGWDKPIVPDVVNVGDTIAFTTELFSKKYPGNHKVVSVRGNTFIFR